MYRPESFLILRHYVKHPREVLMKKRAIQYDNNIIATSLVFTHST